MAREGPASTAGKHVSEPEAKLRESIVRLGRSAEALGLVMHAQGNFSCRIPDTDLLLITPTRVPYSDLEPADLVTLDLRGRKIRGRHSPSSESSTHVLAYRSRPGVGGCVHVEPPHLNALYCVGEQVPNILGNFVYLFGGQGLAVAPPLASGNQEFAERSLAAMGDRVGVVWQNHGLFCVGRDVGQAFERCVAAEQAARVYYLTLALDAGRPAAIPLEVQRDMVRAARRSG
jgi:ribulose-5-phosphate 4-epimerase/fuculose-1-phosphate aldolase